MAYYIHNVPGRLRIKSPKVKGSDRNAAAVQDMLNAIRGINTASINTVTGSITVTYDNQVVKPDDILNTLQKAGYFDPLKASTNDEYIHNMASKAGTTIGKVLFGTFVEKAFEGSALSLLAVLI
jgi:copper chaperone CopZ